MLVKRAYKFRFYPTPAQQQVLAQHFGCVRFVYNHMLARRQQRHHEGIRSSYGEDAAELTALKGATTWLGDVSSVALQQSLRQLDAAYKNFFAKRAKFPRFKRKQAAQSYSLMRNGFTLREGHLTLAKMNEPLDVRWSRALPSAPSSLTVSRDPAGRFFASSKTCHACGFKLKELPLSVREWTCPECGEIHDRDKNAARNILAAGISSLRE